MNRLGGEMGRRMRLTIENNLLVLDADGDFLSPFRRKDQEGGFIGLGKLIDAAVHLAYYSGDDRALEFKQKLVRDSAATQLEDGYLGMFIPERRFWHAWDVHEMSFIVLGLVNDYALLGETASLQSACRLMDYMIARWTEETGREVEPVLAVHLSTIGFEEAILALYEATGDERYRDFCVTHRGLPAWDLGIVKGRHGRFDGHAYGYMARCNALLHLYRMQPDENLLHQPQRVLDFLLRRDGLVISGGCSMIECWHDDQEGAGDLGETCSTAYLLYMLDGLMRVQPDPLYGDVMERAVLNALYGAQSPDGRNLRYYVPFEGKRVYFDKDTYCCPNNFRRIVGALPGMVYYAAGGGIIVNLYTESTAEIPLEGEHTVEIRQETDYPNTGVVRIRINPAAPARFPLMLRVPRWAAAAEIELNGEPVKEPAAAGSFHRIEREWGRGDTVTLRMPMEWQVVRGRKKQAGRAAVMRGPVVFCLNPSRNYGLADADLEKITLDPSSFGQPLRDDTVRPGGLVCPVRAWGTDAPIASPSDLNLQLTEFADPGCEATYFRVPQGANLVDDPLHER